MHAVNNAVRFKNANRAVIPLGLLGVLRRVRQQFAQQLAEVKADEAALEAELLARMDAWQPTAAPKWVDRT